MPARYLGGNPFFRKGTRHGSASIQVYKLRVLKSLTSYLIIIHSFSFYLNQVYGRVFPVYVKPYLWPFGHDVFEYALLESDNCFF